MFRRRIAYAAALVVALTALTALLSAETTRTATLDDVLAEMKALRADLARSSSATIQTQMLVARLQVEEQRMTGIAKQILDVRAQLDPIQQRERSIQALLDRSTDDAEAGPVERKQLALEEQELKHELDGLHQREQDLKTREMDLTHQYAGEEERWKDFNNRLDGLERSLASQ